MSTCRLCGVVAPLINSHIVPDFFIRSLERRQVTGSSGQTQPFSILKSTRPGVHDGAKQRGHWENAVGLKEKLLCAECERRISAYESYVRALLYGSAPPPLKKRVLGLRAAGVNTGGPAGYFIEVRRLSGIDYKQLRLFQLSLLWRASEAGGLFFKNVDLGPKHEPIVRSMLLDENPGKPSDYPCVMVDLQHNGFTFEDLIQQPSSERESGHRVYKMIVGGYLYIYYVSAHAAPSEAMNACIQPSGEMLVLVAEGEQILRDWADALGRAGKLKP